MKLQSRLISAGVVGAFILWTGCAVAYADCLPSARNIGFPDGSAQVRTYICRLDDMDGPSVEVEFDRLSETAAGNLVENTPYPDLSQVFGSPVILHNAVYSEVKNLFDSYGTRQLTSTCYVFAVTGAVPALANYVNDKKNQHCGDKRVLWYLWFPDQENLTTVQMPLLNEEHTYITST